MSTKPIFVATHPRACSTAFERVFMTCRDNLTCIHEPFGDAFYFGPERLSMRYEHDEKERVESGFHESTYQTVLDRIDKEGSEGRRVFIKDIVHYLVPPGGKPATIAPSLSRIERGVGTAEETTNGARNGTKSAPYPYYTQAEPDNPTVVPETILRQFHWTFLIRHPRSSIPSYYRCTIPPLDKITGFNNFDPVEAGYDELRRVFDYLRFTDQIGPKVAGHETNGVSMNGHAQHNGNADKVDICVIDADDLLDNPTGIIEAYCNSVGLKYDPQMLIWDSKEDEEYARHSFAKWRGFHEDAISSSSLKPRLHKKKVKSHQDEDEEWKGKYGEEGAKIIRQTVDDNVKHYEYLKQFALKV